MPDFMHVAEGIDVGPLVAALDLQPELFGVHPQRTEAPGSPHAAVSDIWLRYNDIANLGPGFGDEHDAVWYPAYYALPEIKPLLFGLMQHVEGERLGGVLITKLPPGDVVTPHVDRGWHADYYEKFTIALRNEPGAVFRFPSGDMLPVAGDCYWFDNSIPHSVENNSAEERLALIVCIRTERYRRLRA